MPAPRGRGGLRHIGIIADEFDPDRGRFHNAAMGLGILDVFVVIAIGSIAVGRDRVFGGRPVDRAIGFDPYGHAPFARIF